MLRQFFCFILLLVSTSTFSEELRFEHYSNEKGLSHNSVRSILQDQNGFLWFGTFGGVNRFDGVSFKPFTSDIYNPNYLQDDDITHMVMDDDENIWIGTSNGLTRLHLPTSQFKTFHPDSAETNNICGNKIRALFIDNDKRVWIGTKHNGLCYYDSQEKVFHKIDLGNVEYVRSITQTADNKMWIGTYGEGIYKFDINTNGKLENLVRIETKNKENTSLNSFVYFLYEDHKFDVFAGTREGLFKLNKIKDEFELLEQKNIAIDFFRCITRGPDGFYWIGTTNGLIKCNLLEDISLNSYERYDTDLSYNKSLTNNYVSCLCFDKSGVLWIGTENGVEKYDPFDNQFKMTRIEGVSRKNIPIVSSFGETYDGNILIGTHANGIHLLKDNKINLVSSEDERIVSIYSTDGKIFYCGLWDGRVLKFDYLTSEIKILDVGFQDVPVFSFLKISKNDLLIGSNGDGLIKYNIKSKNHYKIKNDILGKQDINKIIQNNSGIIWLATEYGVFKYNPVSESIKNYTYQDNKTSGLSNDKIKDLIIDSKGKVWASTRHGINFYDPLTDDFIAVTEPIELKNIWVTDMAIDSVGQMWLNMNFNQIAKYDIKNKELHIFSVDNGVRSNIFNKRGFLYSSNKQIYLGGENSLISFNPPTLKENDFSPAPLISEFSVQNNIVIPGDTINGQVILEEDLNYSRKVDLKYNNRIFSITFSSASYVEERQNKFQYMLEGFDKDWINATSNSRTVQYTNLYPDEYLFKIRAINSNGYYSDVSSYQINILPPFWLTYKAFILFFILLAFIIYLVQNQLKKRTYLKQELLLEKVKRERDEKLIDEKLRFFTNISHELRTPISLILGPTKQLVEEDGGTDYQKSRVNLILQNSNRLLYLVNQLLDFRKAQTGELKLKVSKTDILLYTRNTFNSFKGFAKDKKINFNLISEEDSISGWVDRDKLDKVLYNLLSNAIKFTGKYGNVDLFVGIKDLNPLNSRKLVIEVSDDGIGIPLESQKKIFTRFYQAENSKEDNTGSGIGLSLVSSIIKLHKGEIEFESFPEKGTIFTVEIPMDRDYYEGNEIFDYELKPQSLPAVEEKSVKKVVQSTHLKNKVLVIEDNAELRKFIVEYLSDYYKVYEAENGEVGLRVCRQVKPILCVADVMMPIMDGFEFCSALKADELISHIPIILLTALSDTENKIKGYKLGADGYLVKPFDPSLLRTRIDNIIQNRTDLKGKFSEDVDSDVNLLTHSPIDEELMSKLTGIIEEKIGEPELTASFLCNEMGMSSSKLYRKVKELTDLAPNEFIRTIRLKRSVQLLQQKKYNVSEVAIMVGFNDPLYFSRCFKKQFGFPPSKVISK
ncbi:hybrid sensor histidine kinase/response regulator transcription factor [Ancylomarina sp. 16SWW S1-10-2]|uniref:hybrid sensor histidine kinase/response regulator transcription factor n=1 Tax=Ancylomarina sp. 16SWW S1-10-2 TaxID=2499681 RepID=UPI0012AE5A06|nr:hybrid sensor histidine kinase/response regulator transcription factor [Ancylomarina sp. 16SWW S1-10-2]MRT93206.1 hybrid sensor histidine kinase/response regulator [Ancylomarina sp. 16SWW S1-10-2]